MKIQSSTLDTVTASCDLTGMSGTIEFIPVDLTGLSPEEVFAYGVAYGIIGNCGRPVPAQPVGHVSEPSTVEHTTVI